MAHALLAFYVWLDMHVFAGTCAVCLSLDASSAVLMIGQLSLCAVNMDLALNLGADADSRETH